MDNKPEQADTHGQHALERLTAKGGRATRWRDTAQSPSFLCSTHQTKSGASRAQAKPPSPCVHGARSWNIE
eukprot:9494939-Pyramimonas_sp.AAC.1